MWKQTYDRIKKTFVILLAVFLIVTMPVGWENVYCTAIKKSPTKVAMENTDTVGSIVASATVAIPPTIITAGTKQLVRQQYSSMTFVEIYLDKEIF